MTLNTIGTMTKLGYFVKKRRKDLKMTQSEVAGRSGITLRTYQRLEGGSMDMEEFIKISGTLGFKLYLVANESEMFLL